MYSFFIDKTLKKELIMHITIENAASPAVSFSEIVERLSELMTFIKASDAGPWVQK